MSTLAFFILRWPRQANNWVIDGTEFSGIGQWFGGLATAISVYVGMTDLSAQRYQEYIEKLTSEARKVYVDVSNSTKPAWQLVNASDYVVTIRHAKFVRADDLTPFVLPITADEPQSRSRISPRGSLRITETSPLFDVGYLGDRPEVLEMEFELAERLWSIADYSLATIARRL